VGDLLGQSPGRVDGVVMRDTDQDQQPGTDRPDDGYPLEFVLAHPTGYAEVWYGIADGARITLATDVVARTSTAKDYTAGQRMYGLVEGDLMYAFDMAAMGQPMQSHLWGRLARV